MKFSGFNVKIILIEDVYKIPRSGSSADLRFPSKKRWRYLIGRARVWFIGNPVKLLKGTGHLEYRQIHGDHQTANGYPQKHKHKRLY